MQYSVINKDGRKVVIEYVCFGALQMADAWVHELRHAVRLYDVNNELIPWVRNNEEKEEVNGCTYIRGFHPSNFKTLQYLLPETEGVDLFIKHHEEILEHPLFEGITVDNDDANIYASISMEGRQMDATIYPMLMIRNMCQYGWVSNSFSFALEHGASVIEAFFIANLIGRTFGINRERPWYSLDGSDSSILWSTNAPLGDLVEAIKGEMPRQYLDLKWHETDQGYSSYGFLAAPYVNWDDEAIDWDADEEEEDNRVPLPKHPITGNPASLVSSSAFRNVDEYPEHLRPGISTIRPTNDEEFVEFIKKVSTYVKD